MEIRTEKEAAVKSEQEQKDTTTICNKIQISLTILFLHSIAIYLLSHHIFYTRTNIAKSFAFRASASSVLEGIAEARHKGKQPTDEPCLHLEYLGLLFCITQRVHRQSNSKLTYLVTNLSITRFLSKLMLDLIARAT